MFPVGFFSFAFRKKILSKLEITKTVGNFFLMPSAHIERCTFLHMDQNTKNWQNKLHIIISLKQKQLI